MLARNIFIGLILFCGLVVTGFMIFINNPNLEEQEKIRKDLLDTNKKFDNAKHALSELEKIEVDLLKQNEELKKINDRFIKKDQLSTITVKIRNITRDSNLKLLDFTPLFKIYFADTTSAPVKALPFSITVKGKFLDIGRFVENWKNLDFYMKPEEIVVDKLLSNSNELEANITGRLYAWSND